MSDTWLFSNTGKVEVGEVLGHWLYNEFKAILGCLRPCFKQPSPNPRTPKLPGQHFSPEDRGSLKKALLPHELLTGTSRQGTCDSVSYNRCTEAMWQLHVPRQTKPALACHSGVMGGARQWGAMHKAKENPPCSS